MTDRLRRALEYVEQLPIAVQDELATRIEEVVNVPRVSLAGSRAIPLASSYGDESAVAVATPYLLLTAFYLW